ncbi:hypothetical protein HYH03_002723 [Edaphochlamys debaryana]|uniref:RAP domain-containing protein n=1 Tax=Edaphochlamys debaryana TaxID=47281 RepID=A0A835YA32_9CHLO|nr:hypothetical protein HYH03_002723 [Edaphochlamys debaryana]|eukprot:KAG2499140.1 hypothetical protein HYH03_002723 [Edaphochlamys debaryana]
MFADGVRLNSAVDAIITLLACAKAGYWRHGFSEELLQRLSARGGALLRANTAARKAAWGTPPPTQAGRPLFVEHDQADLWILHGCARLGLRHERLTQHLTAQLGSTGAVEDGQAISKALQAIGALTAGSSAEEEAAAEEEGEAAEEEEGEEEEEEKSGQDEPDDESMGAASEAAPSDPQDGANIPWAPVASVLDSCASLGCADPSIIGPLAAAAVRAAPLMSARSLANTARALAKLGYAEQGVYAALAEAAVQPGAMQGARPQDWEDLWYALVSVRHRPPPSGLLARTVEAAQTLRHGAGPQVCTNMLWALAVLRLYDEQLVGTLAVRLVKLLGRSTVTVTEQDLSISLWALAVIGLSALSRHSAAAQELLREVARRWEAGGRTSFRQESLSQLQQVQVELEAIGDAELYGILGSLEGDGQGSLLLAARNTASRQNEEGATSSAEVAVVAALEELQQQLSPGVIVAVQPGAPVGQARVADVLVELADGRRVAVEVDGPTHFLASHPHHPKAVDGSTKLRDRQLERVLGAGNVLSVPWWEWNALKKKRARRAYLCGLLGLETA